MLYNQPFDQPNLPQAPYVNGNPGTGTPGSIPSAAGLEYDQREIVNALVAAGIVPDNGDLCQLTRAVRGGQLDFASDTGTADAMVATIGLGHNSLKAGLPFTVLKGNAPNATTTPKLTIIGPAGGNPGPSTSTTTTISGTIVKATGAPVAIGDLPANTMLTFRADGVNFRLVSLMAPSDAPQITPNSPILFCDVSGSDTTGNGTQLAPYRNPYAALIYGVSRFALGGKTFGVQLMNPGTYAAPPTIPSSIGSILVQGDSSAQAANQDGYILAGAPSGGSVISLSGVAVRFRGLKILNTTGAGNNITAQTGGAYTLDCVSLDASGGTTTGSLAAVFAGGTGSLVNNIGMYANCSSALSGAGGAMNVAGVAMTVGRPGGGTIAVTSGFATAYQSGGSVSAVSTTFMGSGATGPKYNQSLNGSINTNGGGTNYWPGNAAGTAAAGSYA